MSDKQLTCEERIDEQLKWALEDVEGAVTGYFHECYPCSHEWSAEEEEYECPKCESDDVYAQDSFERYAEGVLEASPLWTVYRVMLSTGGPADGYYVYVYPDGGGISHIEYYFQDWYDGAVRGLSGSDFDEVSGLMSRILMLEER